MKRHLFKAAAAALLAALVLAPASGVQAQSKPVLVISLSGVDEIVNDIQYVLELSGNGPAGQIAAMSAAQYSQGLDTSRPIAVVVSANGDEIEPLGMVPVKDLDQFLTIISQQTGEPQDVGDGIKEIAGPQSVFVKEKDGWAFVSNTKASLSDLPAKPLDLLKGMNADYDIGIRAIMPNIPQKYRDQWIAQIKQGMQMQLDNTGADSPLNEEVQRKMLDAQIEQWETIFNETQELVFGLNIDRKKQQAHIDVTTIAIPGTKTAQQLAMLKEATSKFSGFIVEDAALNWNMVGKLTEADIRQMMAMIGPLQDAALEEIDKDDDLPNDEAKDAAKKMLTQLFGVFEETVKSGTLDGAGALVINDKNMTFITGMHVADGAKLEKTFKDLVEMAKDEPDFPGVKMNADQLADTRFHTMSIPIPEGEDARNIFGEKLDVAIGIGTDSAYVGLGHDCVGQLKSAIQKSQGGGTVSPLRVNVALEPILTLASSFDDNPMLTAFAGALKEHAGRDNILITAKAIENGATYRIEIQDGILKSLGEINQSAGANF